MGYEYTTFLSEQLCVYVKFYICSMHDTTRYDAMRYDTHILDFVYVLRVLFLFSNDWFFSGIFYFHHFRFSSRLVSALLLLELFFTVQFFFFRFSATRRKWFCTRQDSFLSSIRSSSACVYVCAENLSICHAMPFAQSILKKYAICYWNLHILLNMCVCVRAKVYDVRTAFHTVSFELVCFLGGQH